MHLVKPRNAPVNTHPTQDPRADAGIDLVFDALILGQGHRAAVSRGGIYRYASQLLISLERLQRNRLLPYCPDPLLAESVAAELTQLRQRSMGAPVLARRTPSWLLRPPAPVKAILKPLYRRVLASKLLRQSAEGKLRKALDRCHPGSTVFHTPFQCVPPEVRRAGLPSVVTVHDMLPLIHPEFFTEETIRHFRELVDTLQPTDHVICVSDSTRKDFLRFSQRIPESQIHVTPLAASPELGPIRDPAALAKTRQHHGLGETDTIILSLCTLEPRKNLRLLIEVFESIHSDGEHDSLKLVLAGSLGWKTTALMQQIQDSPACESIVITGHVPDQQLAALFSTAAVFVYPSLYEGFGLPPLEAMQCGAPVIVGATSSLPEVTGEAALKVDPRSAAELRAAIEQVLASPSLRRTLSTRSLEQASLFSWRRTAEDTADIYEKALGR
ncbi:glycosyltransferase family 1 protein [Synechococcus sp. RedBA-s]|uniref:glycosyltransferase family 4 protein n=1 Tax=Synechococcus sp. RedBA-s TaxID=2823741 RepID=UPI0020CCC8A2|nr:glycosyltransferase family 1 protein [Synechococcus sp. RedBA-s]MCP9799194.1 glycosyltransferase family 4 protein [Synechococcus sp. RedBA-s]